LEALGNLAHELRTPLQVMLGYLDVLRGEWADGLGDEPRRILERMDTNAHELAHTVENLMDFAAVEAGAQAEIFEDIAIANLVAELIPVFEAANQSKGLALRFDLGQAPVAFRSRRRALRLILQNLILNAIKFTTAGSVAVTVRRDDLNGGTPKVMTIEVRDTGPGISPDEIELACAPLVQLSQSSARRYRGMGLGLAVVRRNVAVLGGDIEARSAPDAGSTFTVRLPAASAEDSYAPGTTTHKRGRASILYPRLHAGNGSRATLRRQAYR